MSCSFPGKARQMTQSMSFYKTANRVDGPSKKPNSAVLNVESKIALSTLRTSNRLSANASAGIHSKMR